MKAGGARDWYEAVSKLGANESTIKSKVREPEYNEERSVALLGINPAKDRASNK